MQRFGLLTLCRDHPLSGRPFQDELSTVEVLNLATGESSQGLNLPSASSGGCAAYDSGSGYVYYMEG